MSLEPKTFKVNNIETKDYDDKKYVLPKAISRKDRS